ncbi:hypothetical protein LWC34_30025 [Kibdelosporangium philippinense]|uniref:Integrase SAM-like N-terminal domain-containing protein n=1 Tax=Kibdelosporangium philippinense TaxID=211113 RepID=A0ABS8ZHJ8_9PSEU|nr:hypothetical protein [Kibdelosporangium philippinense]MCE7007037.1 hypothetical protein [Kibdelosporangium philippinense]
MRGLAPGTVTHYLRCARVFLEWLPGSHGSLSGLSAGRVTGFVMQWVRGREGMPPDMVMLPALLRFLHVAGHVPALLARSRPDAAILDDGECLGTPAVTACVPRWRRVIVVALSAVATTRSCCR